MDRDEIRLLGELDGKISRILYELQKMNGRLDRHSYRLDEHDKAIERHRSYFKIIGGVLSAITVFVATLLALLVR
jgi:division protein CdvB (Snf7/Vps24/ESCRT-III family)